jgi:K+-sensing histidine kinase KdpD
MDKLLERLTNLFEIKSIITLLIIGTIVVLALKGQIEAKEIVLFGGIILTYFFTKDINKKA